ncbi:transcription-repair coupling factor (superfamily II helicase) [Ruminiclostridium sufflavum DSM 19573]|uniref:Transcription-repair-coupling factor n=1 Tax=Ruminiclostridium sufflavum DSM 19573 TaxID=1121337 RepID=A0A318XLR0_9FIRM|nr:transcription-repair coupling factor [Ruminiclostridium sufflavum]PYG88267.1 transcription-repair coupling factor (superfamily II helicase) [Ruminiclostridium sufflavum DSM 19573]
MNLFTDPLLNLKEYNTLLSSVRDTKEAVSVIGPSDSQKVHLIYSLCTHTNTRGLFVTYNEIQARRAFDDFSLFLGDDVIYLPPKETMLYNVEARSNDLIYQRVKTLSRCIQGDYRILVLPAEALIQMISPLQIFKSGIIDFYTGLRIDLEELVSKLVLYGYERVELVEGKAQFAVRGGIIDIFSTNNEQPLRIELFDTEVDSIRYFDAATQRSTQAVNECRIVPARDVVYRQDLLEDIVRRIKKDLSDYVNKLNKKNNPDISNNIIKRVNEDIERINTNHYFAGIDRYLPYILGAPASVLDYVDSNAIVVLDETLRIEQRIENIALEQEELAKSMLEKGAMLPNGARWSHSIDYILKGLQNFNTVTLAAISSNNSFIRPHSQISIPCRTGNSYQNHIELLVNDIEHLREKDYKIIVLSGPSGRGHRLIETLATNGIDANYTEDCNKELMSREVAITRGSLQKGFEYPTIGFVIISDKEVFGQDKRIKKAKSKHDGNKIKAFSDLNVGDFVVHQAHGIGQYIGIEKLAVGEIKRDYLKIKYQDNGFLYIPTNQLDLIQKYIGNDGKDPKVNKLGGSEWAKTKNRVKESLRELAGELIKLYAQRQVSNGFAFSKDTVWQRQFEEMFPYEETDDQLKCIDEIKQDMESDKHMDRLLCGDVGYGKTEVAIRAVFKAVMDGKQVAYLVPTTILAQQQYENFKKRMSDFPVTVDVISRFRTPAEQKKIIKSVKSGNIDILIGTHRILQKDISFKDLGLLVVDEEQRFGVTHKEKLKGLKPNVDSLTLTATPIPRTLHMSLVGIRDISVIEDPPEERYPVQTYVMEHNDELIRDGIIRELSRKGQVFYLYNRVRGIELKANEIKRLVPEARVAVAHGQMNEKELEDVMYNFINAEFDILVCTTIIESGLDMPNVNTIVVEDADKMGLSQLYQIRGRVGRSNRLAYAYITYKKDKALSEVAEKRLQAIKEFTEFGSGFRIAMRDLEIRGAGNLLGSEQHGHMETVGYEMYCKLLEEAVHELSGDSSNTFDDEMAIDLNVSAYIDDDYIESEELKIDMYKKIAAIQDENDVIDIKDELIDRYGDIPGEVENLMDIAYIKALANKCSFINVQQKEDTVIFQLSKSAVSISLYIGAIMDKYPRRIMFNASSSPYITFRLLNNNQKDILANIKILLHDIIKLQYS